MLALVPVRLVLAVAAAGPDGRGVRLRDGPLQAAACGVFNDTDLADRTLSWAGPGKSPPDCCAGEHLSYAV